MSSMKFICKVICKVIGHLFTISLVGCETKSYNYRISYNYISQKVAVSIVEINN